MIDELDQFPQGLQRHPGPLFLRHRPALDGIEHPVRNGQRRPRGELDHEGLNSKPAAGSRYFDLHPVEGVMPVVDLS